MLFEIPSIKVTSDIFFLVDTGATFSSICEKDAVAKLGLDCDSLPESKGRAIGFKGFFKTRMINSPAFLVFKSDKGENYRLPYGGGFKVMYISPQLPPEDREKALGLTPSILGMDILCKFKVYADKKKVVLTFEKP